MTDDHSPIEYSWKWGKAGEAPEVRYAVEAFHTHTGSELDPLNQTPARTLLEQVRQAMPNSDVDVKLFKHLQPSCFGEEIAASVRRQGILGKSSMFLGFEMGRGKIAVKAYFMPVDLPDGPSAAEQIAAAIQSSPGFRDSRGYEVFQIMEEYLRDDPEGATLTPFMLAIDCVEPAKSLLKVYVRSPHTSFRFARNAMTLGGRRGSRGQFDAVASQFHDLWNVTLGLDPTHHTDKDLRKKEHATAGICFNFDVGQQSSVPDVKAYIPVRHYACSDGQAALGLTEFLAKHERADYARKYMQMIESLAVDSHKVDTETGVQTYISCAYKDGYVCLTSYLSPQIYHAARWAEGSKL